MDEQQDLRDRGSQNRESQSGGEATDVPGLGHEVYRRYSVDPGVTRSTSGFGLGEGMARFALDRIGLLAGIQNRWKSTNSQAHGEPQIDRIWSAGKSPFGKQHIARRSGLPPVSRAAVSGVLPAPPHLPESSSSNAVTSSDGPASGVEAATPLNARVSRAVKRLHDSVAQSGGHMSSSFSGPKDGLKSPLYPVGYSTPASRPAFEGSPIVLGNLHASPGLSGGLGTRSGVDTAQTGSQALEDRTASVGRPSSSSQSEPSSTGRPEGHETSNDPQLGAAMIPIDSPGTSEVRQIPAAEHAPASVQQPILGRAARRSVQLQRQSVKEKNAGLALPAIGDIEQQGIHSSPAMTHADPAASHIENSLPERRAESSAELIPPTKASGSDESNTGSAPSQPSGIRTEQIASTQAESIAKSEVSPSISSSGQPTRNIMRQPHLPSISFPAGHATPVLRKPKDVAGAKEISSRQPSAGSVVQRAKIAAQDSSQAADSSQIQNDAKGDEPSPSSGLPGVSARPLVVQAFTPANIAAPVSTIHAADRNQESDSRGLSSDALSHQARAESARTISPTATRQPMVKAAAGGAQQPIYTPAQPVWRTPASVPAEGPGESPATTAAPSYEAPVLARNVRPDEIAQTSAAEALPTSKEESGQFAANPQTPEWQHAEQQMTIGNPAVDGQSPTAAPLYAGGTSSLTKSVVQRSPAGSVRGLDKDTSLPSPPVPPSSSVVLKPLPVMAQSSPASIHRSAGARGVYTSGVVPRASSTLNHGIGFSAGSGSHSSASYPVPMMVQRSSSSPASPPASPALPSALAQPSNDPSQPASSAVNMTQLASRVYDLLVRRLASEQQRRGA